MSFNHNHPWTDEAVAKLKELRAAGNSFGIIAALMGVSRNACIGKATRLGLVGPTDASKPKSAIPLPRTRKPRQRPFVLDTARFQRDMADPAFDVPVELPPALPPVTAKFLLELKPGECRYPYGHIPDMLFCGAVATHGSYCAEHHAVTHQRGKYEQRPVEGHAHIKLDNGPRAHGRRAA